MLLLFVVGVVPGRGTDAGHIRVTFALVVFLQLQGIGMTSLCTQYWQIFLAQAVCIGPGNGQLHILPCPGRPVLLFQGVPGPLASSGGAT